MGAVLETYELLLEHVPSNETETRSWPEGVRSDADLISLLKRVRASDDAGRKQALAYEVDRFVATRVPENEKLQADWRLCQAMWASRDDSVEGRVPERRDRYILLPRSTDGE